MHLKPALLLLALLPLGAAAQTVLPATTYSAQAVVVSDATSIANGTSGAPTAVTVSSGATVTFHSNGIITLRPGFTAASGSKFFATIAASCDSDSDGLPDVWERAYGLSVGTNDAASDADSDGLSNLSEYLLGTKPNGGSSNTSDSGNTTALKIHRPITP